MGTVWGGVLQICYRLNSISKCLRCAERTGVFIIEASRSVTPQMVTTECFDASNALLYFCNNTV